MSTVTQTQVQSGIMSKEADKQKVPYPQLLPEQVFDAMQKAKLQPNDLHYTALMRACTKGCATLLQTALLTLFFAPNKDG